MGSSPGQVRSSKTVEFHRLGRVVLIRPDVAVLRRHLTFIEPVVRQAADDSIAIGRQTNNFCRDIASTKYPIWIHAGLEPAAIRICKREKYHVELTGARHPPVARDPFADGSNLQRYAPTLAFIAAHESGLIRYDWNKVEPAEIIAEAARAWPSLTISVVSNKVGETRRVRDVLRAMNISCTAANHQNRPAVGEVGRVVMTTPKAIWADGVDFKARDIVFVMDGITAWQKKAHLRVMDAHAGRLYGFVPLDATHSPMELDCLRALFGFAAITVPAPECIERAVVVSSERIFGGTKPGGSDSAFRLKQSGIWYHGLRNRRIAKLAQDAAEPFEFDRCPVVVLVEGVDHARKLSRLMPQSLVITDDFVRTDGMSPLQLADLNKGKNPFSDRSRPFIVTTNAFSRMDLSQVQTVIRADGGVGLPPIFRHQLVAPEATPPLQIIDFLDHHDPELLHQSQVRGRRYRDQEWLAPDADPVLARVDRFLAARPSARRETR